MSDLTQRLHKIAEDYVKGYELRDDAACHTPNDLEHTMLMDCTIGVVDEIVQVVAAEIERLERANAQLSQVCETISAALHRADDAERQRDEAIAALRERLWIPVGERLPDDKQEVRFVPLSGNCMNGWYEIPPNPRPGPQNGLFYRGDGLTRAKPASSYTSSVVTHWMPLPAAPESARRLLNQKEGT